MPVMTPPAEVEDERRVPGKVQSAGAEDSLLPQAARAHAGAAGAIGRSVSFVSQVEANNSSRVKGVSLETLFLIAERLDIPASKLFEE